MSAVLEYPQRHAVSAEEYLRMGEAGVAHRPLSFPVCALGLRYCF